MKLDINLGNSWWLGLLSIVFITLKLTGYINWSWIWVLAPIWLPFVIGLGLLILILYLKSR